ncbi:MAG: hypothetical protein AB7N80_14670 [Bdellovibrionales bacterium]
MNSIHLIKLSFAFCTTLILLPQAHAMGARVRSTQTPCDYELDSKQQSSLQQKRAYNKIKGAIYDEVLRSLYARSKGAVARRSGLSQVKITLNKDAQKKDTITLDVNMGRFQTISRLFKEYHKRDLEMFEVYLTLHKTGHFKPLEDVLSHWLHRRDGQDLLLATELDIEKEVLTELKAIQDAPDAPIEDVVRFDEHGVSHAIQIERLNLLSTTYRRMWFRDLTMQDELLSSFLLPTIVEALSPRGLGPLKALGPKEQK